MPLFALAACSASASSGPLSAPVNDVIGDYSWSKLRGTPPATGPEDERIAVHLEWVEAELRGRAPAGLTAEQRHRRAQLLDELGRYRRAEQYPVRSDGAPGRRPLWVDERGTHCAVAHLVAASGDEDTVAEVQRRHRFDLVRNMKSERLLAWADHHGFRARELGMIQPTYESGGSVHVPTRRQEEAARRRALAEARKPRPLTRDVLDRALGWYVSRKHRRECFGARTGRFELAGRLRVTRGKRVGVRVRVTPAGKRKPDRALSRCWTRRLRRVASNLLRQKNYRVASAMTASAERTLVIPDAAAVEAAFLSRPAFARHHRKTREQALARCLTSWPAERLPATLDVEVSSWNGDVSVRQDPALRASFGRDLGPWHCVGDVLRYERITPVPSYDHRFSITVDASGGIDIGDRYR